MNFYQAQDDARKQSSWLIMLFSLAVLGLVLITNLVVAIFFYFSDLSNTVNGPTLSFSNPLIALKTMFLAMGWSKIMVVSGVVTGTIFIAMFFKWLSLRSGGRVIAESMGGTKIQTNTRDPDEKKLLNVVEEMALASSVPVPPVYVLKYEQGINAFAAGYSTKDAVIGVSQGCMELLDREQLQGVIAHEFSHILNGDMRLNLRIIAVLHGILMIGQMGRFFIDIGRPGYSSFSSRRRDSKATGFLMAFGLVLWLLGWIGYFFGAMIKAGVSRQREYLADASAVQYTRNPDGIAGALKMIGGHADHSLINHASSHELSHMFFSQSFNGNWLATHPPLDERIRQILPQWDGKFLKPKRLHKEPVDPLKVVQENAMASSLASGATESIKTASLSGEGHGGEYITNIDPAFMLIPAELKEIAHEPLGALGICLAMLICKEDDIKAKQVDAVLKHQSAWLTELEAALKHTRDLKPEAWLPVIESAIPAIKELSLAQYKSLRSLMTTLIRTDGKIGLSEWVLFELVRQHGDRHFSLARDIRPKYKTLKSVESFYVIVLSRLIYYGSSDEEVQNKAFGIATNASGMYASELVSLEKCSGAAFTRAIHEIGKAFPLVKPRLMKGLVQAAKADGIVNVNEKMVVSIIALIWDCPLVGLDEF